MKKLDRFIQNWRMRKAARYVAPKARVIDIGAHEGEFFSSLGSKLVEGFGIEPLAKKEIKNEGGTFRILPGVFPAVSPDTRDWDAISMLAVLEHIPRNEQSALASACLSLLKPGGRLIVTVPGPVVDSILGVLRFFRLIDGMSLEEHYGFEPGDTVRIFSEPGFRLLTHERFQLGINHLFVFEKRPTSGGLAGVVR